MVNKEMSVTEKVKDRINQLLTDRAAELETIKQKQAELEQIITEEENREIVGIIRRYRIGIDHLEQIMQGVRPAGESLFSEEKDKPVPGTDDPEKKSRADSQQASGPAADNETEKEENQSENE